MHYLKPVKSVLIPVAALAAILSAPAFAQGKSLPTEIPGCYQRYDQLRPVTPAPLRTLYVVIDQTLALPDELQNSITQKVQTFLKPGDELIVVPFSALTGEAYARVAYSGHMEHMLPKSDTRRLPIAQVKQLEKCLDAQYKYGLGATAAVLKDAMNDRPQNPMNTELLYTINNIVAPHLKNEGMSDARLLIISDMFENSSSITFYQNGQIRGVEEEALNSALERFNGAADLFGMKVYIHGAGFVYREDGQVGYLPGEAVENVRTFWEQYFDRANADLVDFGQPELLGNIE